MLLRVAEPAGDTCPSQSPSLHRPTSVGLRFPLLKNGNNNSLQSHGEDETRVCVENTLGRMPDYSEHSDSGAVCGLGHEGELGLQPIS